MVNREWKKKIPYHHLPFTIYHLRFTIYDYYHAMIAYENLEDIFNSIDERRRRLLAATENLTEAQACFRPSPDAWAIAEIVEHLALTEQSLTHAFNIKLAQLENASEPDARRPMTREEFRASAAKLNEHSSNSVGKKVEAPERLRPSSAKTLAEARAALDESRAALRALRPRFEKVNLCAVTFPHPLFGALDLAQWLYFIGMHEAHHLRQINKNIEHPEFSKIGSTPAANAHQS
jgi:hypothetical protein